MIQDIKDAADAVGIVAFITNSENKIQTQLNTLTKESDLPILLVSWDIDVTVVFDDNGFLENPTVDIVALLVHKPEDLRKEIQEEMAQAMGYKFQEFLQELHKNLVKFQKQVGSPIFNASYKLVPKHGAGKHSGVLGRFSMKIAVTNC